MVSPQALGERAEEAVVRYLLDRKYTVLERNLRLGPLEIDILARLGRLVIVVEVRHRGLRAWQTAFESIDKTKQKRLRQAAERLWSERFDSDPSVENIRFDIASVDFTPKGTVVHYIEGGLDASD